MRTTVTLDPDVQALLKKVMRERGLSFKEALNQAIRSGLSNPAPKARRRFKQRTFAIDFLPGVNLIKANQLAGELEDEEIIRKMEMGK